MPFTATSSSFGIPPRDPFDTNERYVVRVKSITEKEMPKYENPEEKEMKAIWAFEVHHMDGKPVVAADGGIFTVEDFTRLNVAASKPGKPTSKARTYMEAVLGRDPQVAVDSGEDIMATALGRFAYALFDSKIGTTGNSRIVILKLSPIANQEAAASATGLGIASASQPAAAAPGGLPF